MEQKNWRMGMSKKLIFVIFLLISFVPILYADVGTWTKRITNHLKTGNIIEIESYLGLHENFVFDNNVKISLDSPDIFRIRYDSRKDELDFRASFNEVCSIKAYGKKGTLIAKESFYSNKKYPDAFGKSVAAMVDSIDVECSSLSNEKYLCAGDEISCKKDNEKLVVYLVTPFSDSAKQFRTEVGMANCVDLKAPCFSGWHPSWDCPENDCHIMYCEPDE